MKKNVGKIYFWGAGGLKNSKITKNMLKLGHYLPFRGENQKMKIFCGKSKKLVFGGLGVENPLNNQKYAKTSALPTF